MYINCIYAYMVYKMTWVSVSSLGTGNTMVDVLHGKTRIVMGKIHVACLLSSSNHKAINTIPPYCE